jgi:RHS repeat-associated protein
LVGATPAHFTDQDRDGETGLDHFLYRQYSSVQGRWMMPDPAGIGAVYILIAPSVFIQNSYYSCMAGYGY